MFPLFGTLNGILDAKGFAVDQGVGDFFSGGFYDSTERRAGDPHVLGGFIMVKVLGIGQTNGFQFVHFYYHLLQIDQGNAPRFEIKSFGLALNSSGGTRAGHE